MNHALQFKALKYRIFWFQILITLLLTLGVWFYQGSYASLSVSLGGLIAVVPSFVFASFYPSSAVKRQAQAILKRLYWGETVKLLVTALLFILVFQWSDLQVIYLFISFIIMQIVSIIVSSCAS
jgi:ATP synthase protein I